MVAPFVVKLGGRALETPGASFSLAAELQAIGEPCVVVHGGGPEVTEWSARLGIEPRFVEGLRVTDEATMDVAAAVLAGLANKRLVALLRGQGVDAVGLAALDGGIVSVVPHPNADKLGSVGVVRSVNPALLETLLAAGHMPILSSIASRKGRLFNVNADDLAAALAAALRAKALVMLSDAPGLVLNGEVVPRMGSDDIPAALRQPGVEGGMRPKLRAARAAINGGAARVHIAPWNGPGTLAALAAGAGPGTLVEAGVATVPSRG